MRLLRTKKSRVLLAVALLAAATVIAVVLLPHEPTYNGKSLSYWLDRLPCTWIGADWSVAVGVPLSYRTAQEAMADEARVSEETRQAKCAVDAIGTNGLRTILSRLRSRDSKAKLTVQRWATRIGLLDPGPGLHCAETRRGQALTALWRLHDRARPIAPGLVALTVSDDAGIRATAFSAISKVAPEYEREGQLR